MMRKWSVLLRALQVVIAVALMAIILESSLPLNWQAQLIIHYGFTGPTVPIMALFSNIAITRNDLHFVSTMWILAICAVQYFMAIVATLLSLEQIQENHSKFFDSQISRIFFAGANIIVLIADLTLTILEKTRDQENHNSSSPRTSMSGY